MSPGSRMLQTEANVMPGDIWQESVQVTGRCMYVGQGEEAWGEWS